MSDPYRTPEFAAAIVAELATAIGSVADGPVTAAAAPVAAGEGWTVTLAATAARTGGLSAWVDRAGAAAVARLVMGGDDDPDDATVADMLREMWSQAASAVCLTAPYAGLKLAVSGPEPAPAAAAPSGFAVDLAGHATASVTVSGAFDAAAVAAPPPAPAPAAPPAVRVASAGNPNLDVVLDIELPLVVRFGRTVMSLKALSGLGPGSIVDMGRSPDEPVELLVSDKVIARGEVVIVAGNYGVRVTDLVSAADRVRALEA